MPAIAHVPASCFDRLSMRRFMDFTGNLVLSLSKDDAPPPTSEREA
jgi:hypothetical protein